MLDTNTLLIIIISVQAALLIVLFFGVLLLIKDIRSTILKVNTILDTIDTTAKKLSEPIMSAKGALGAITEGLKVANMIKKLVKNDVQENK